ncbi:hypothetical protein OF83DRAFT_1172024 [Amylostereum chailletii]|nr:hypothetical protein OF83DRAFT_1172024 [Amylostereum chailletii]
MSFWPRRILRMAVAGLPLMLTVGQVRAIFRLPPRYDPDGTHPVLAYLERFTKFTIPVPDLRMFQVSRSTRSQRRRASIIPVTSIMQSAHLFPKHPRQGAASTDWTADDVYEKAKTFHVNPFLRHYEFSLSCEILSIPPD